MSTPPGGPPPPYDPNQPPYGSQPPPGGYGNQPPPGGYGSQPGGGASGSQNNGLAITSLVLGILGIPLLCLCGLGGPLAIAAIVTGHLGKKKADNSQGSVGGRGMAKAGFILGIIGTVLFLAFIVLWIIAIATGEDFNYQYGTDFS